MSEENENPTRGYRVWLFWALVIVAFAALFAPQAGFYGVITVIGFPIAVFYWLSPALLFIIVASFLFKKALPARLQFRGTLSVVAVLIVLAATAAYLNIGIKKHAKAFVADDHNDITLPLTARTIAVRQAYNYSGNQGISACDAFCQHALVTGSADRVLFAWTSPGDGALQKDQNATAFRLERQPVCQPVRYASTPDKFAQASGGFRASDIRAADLLNLRASEGECLVEEEAMLSEADLIVSRELVKSGIKPVAAKFSVFLDTASVGRTSVYVPDRSKGGFKEIYRQTEVTYSPFGWLMIPFPNFGYGFEMSTGWWRSQEKVNIPKSAGQEDTWNWFLTETLGLKLALSPTGARDRIRQKIETAMSAGRAPTAVEWKTFSDALESALLQPSSSLDRSNFDFLTNILANPNLPPPPRLYTLVDYAKSQHPEGIPALAAVFIKRALQGRTWPDSVGVSEAKSLSILELGISRLPDDALLPYFEEMTRLADNPQARRAAPVALVKLHVFGERAVPTMLGLMQAGLSGGEYFSRTDEYQQPYLAGLQGLCHAGSAASSALPQLRTWLDEERVPLHATYGELLMRTMVRMGADRELFWPIYAAQHPNQNRGNFDQIIGSAAGTSRACRW